MKQRQRILIVDDDPGITGLVKKNLEQTGHFDVRTENGGVEGVQAAREFRPDLLLLDVVMPHCDGADVLAQLRADPELCRTPIIFLTGTMSEAGLDQRQGMIEGCRVVSKQAKLKNLTQQIEKTLRAVNAGA